MAGQVQQGQRRRNTERNIVLGLAGALLLAIVLVSLFGPAGDDANPQPTTYNDGSAGAKAAYLLAGDLGYDARRWEQKPPDLKQVDAANTTLLLAEPLLPVMSLKATQQEIEEFLQRGGRVVATGSSGAELLPGGKTAATQRLYQQLCYTRPEGAGELAQAGKVSIGVPVRWDANGPEFRVEERCGADAVVVRYPVGKGEAVWWSSPMPLTNAGISDDASLKLLLASLGPVSSGGVKRTVLFDEYLHAQRESIADTVSGMPWWPLTGQVAAVGVLLVFSFSRRNGPIRKPVRMPRTSPLEFAESMGRLYHAANATEAPLAAARAQLMRYLAEGCGLSHDIVRQTPSAIAEALSARMGGDWGALAEHLEAAAHAGDRAPTSKLALKLVQALEQDQRHLAAQVSAAQRTGSQ